MIPISEKWITTGFTASGTGVNGYVTGEEHREPFNEVVSETTLELAQEGDALGGVSGVTGSKGDINSCAEGVAGGVDSSFGRQPSSAGVGISMES